MNGKLILDNGFEFYGTFFGKKMNIEGEVVFNTSMVGYPESLTDASYKNQILVLNSALITQFTNMELQYKTIWDGILDLDWIFYLKKAGESLLELRPFKTIVTQENSKSLL